MDTGFEKLTAEQLCGWGLKNVSQAKDHLRTIASCGASTAGLSRLSEQLEHSLQTSKDPDRLIADLADLVSRSSADAVLRQLLVSSPDILVHILTVLTASPYLSRHLCSDHHMIHVLVDGEHFGRDLSQRAQRLYDSVESIQSDFKNVVALLGTWKNRELFRIAYGSLISDLRLEVVANQISSVCSIILDVAIKYLLKKHEARWGVPRGTDGKRTQLVLIGLGKLGGQEMNYSNNLELMCIYGSDGETDGSRSQTNRLFFSAIVEDLKKMLGTTLNEEVIYQINYQANPTIDSTVMTTKDAWRYFDVSGRTSERQALIKSRPVAGDLDLGEQFLSRLESWIYPHYLSVAEITEIKSLKRRIEQLTRTAGEETVDLEKGRGGIRDIEFVIQFLQLLHGGELSSIRVSNTLQAIERLGAEGCLRDQEQTLLADNYRFLCSVEHRLQLTFGPQAYRLPREGRERDQLAEDLGYAPVDRSGGQSFTEAYSRITEENRRVLNHLLHDAFATDSEESPEIDLILDPAPTPERIHAILRKYSFTDPNRAYSHLMDLTRETVPFLSTRRCRYFLATIAGDLLREVSQFPDPDSTLMKLCRTSESLGGKGVLWELFSFNRASLKLYVTLCANSPYLSNILNRNPGMIDELMDGLMLKKLPDFQQQEAALLDLCGGAEDIDPMIQSFNKSQILRVGVRDIVGKERVEATSGALADIAETCLRQWARVEYSAWVRRCGEPVIAMGPRAGHIAEFVILALGRLGGREMGYGGDLELVFLYEADGGTQHRRSERKHQQVTSNQHFFEELSQRVIQRVTRRGPYGRLYGIELPLRSVGAPLAISLSGLVDYFQGDRVTLRERMALSRARVVLGNEVIHSKTMEVVHQIAFFEAMPWNLTDEAWRLREQAEANALPEDFHLGRGGILDIEFIAQVMQIHYGSIHPTLRQSNTLAALLALREKDLLASQDYEILKHNYRLLRRLETRRQWMEGTSPTLLPTGEQLSKLAFMLSAGTADELQQSVDQARRQNRDLLERVLCDKRIGTREIHT